MIKILLWEALVLSFEHSKFKKFYTSHKNFALIIYGQSLQQNFKFISWIQFCDSLKKMILFKELKKILV